KRIQRLYVTLFVIYISTLAFGYYFMYPKYELYLYIILWLFVYLIHYVVMFANYINTPVEKLVGLYYITKAKRKLKSMSNMSVIGITGSYGKTSSKNILSDILNVKFNAMPTPKNFNTPFGLTRTINENLDKFNDFFIAEMGACKTGEIKELCNLVHPKYGILTKIGVAHLETFKSEENIQKTKFELIESLPADGVGVLNIDDPKQKNYKGNFKCKIITIGIDDKDADVKASNIKLSNTGTMFKVKFKGDKKEYLFETKLLGKANIYNILAGIALGDYLGISKDMLIGAVKKVTPVEHRLQLKKYLNMHLIDDAYNANPDGCKMALDVLNMMPGKRIVISSGMIELGNLSDSLHLDLGKYMSDKTDEVILIGKEQTKYIYKGLIDSNYNKENIHVLNNIMDAFSLLNKLGDKDTYVLLQSDLPDIFNEK
ncbi:MAG: UDP-N-acetylmuramoyl-tripeptide--D-alanyl-D-alanine ligase, partial [Bacilli bacterium]|nr:UDP-N-acetylmuramoyl-tripeptide--D-alanyl-D-alanine ligase [Bacilli bacterium]